MPAKVCAVAAGEAHTLALTCNDARRLARRILSGYRRNLGSEACSFVWLAGLAGNGEVYSWGRGTFGRLGTGREADVHVPTAVVPAAAVGGAGQRPRFAAVAAGAYHSLALDG
jgi:alpha-tubulin suppressor-like RCC1 family protein